MDDRPAFQAKAHGVVTAYRARTRLVDDDGLGYLG